MRLLILALATVFALSGCQHKTSPPGEAPTGVTVTPGDGLVVVRWDTLPDLTYWIFFQPGSTVAVATPESFAIRGAFSPRVVGLLANQTQYAFVMNATNNDSAAGPNSFPRTATPMLAGGTWTSGAALGAPPQNLKSMTFNGSRFVTVGDAAAIFAGDFNYTNATPPGVTAWTKATSLPTTGFASNLSSVIFNGSTAFVALGADGSIISSPSADGLNWLSNTSVPSTGMNGLAFGFVSGSIPTYIAVGDGGKIFTSTDTLATWTAVTSGTTSDLKSISLLNGTFFVTGAGGTLLTSFDGTTWTPLVSNTPNTLRGVAFTPFSLGIRYVAVGDAGTIVTSLDALTWSAVAPPLAQDLRSVTVGGAALSRFLAVGQGGAVAYSDDGITWPTVSSGSANLAKVLYVGGLYMGIGDAGANAVSPALR